MLLEHLYRFNVIYLCIIAHGWGEGSVLSLLSAFPNSVHLLCTLHKRDNIIHKLRELRTEEKAARVILNDIFGSKVDDNQFGGLIDANGSS